MDREMLARALMMKDAGNMMGGGQQQALMPQFKQEMTELQMNGQPPIPFEQWAQQFMQQQQQDPGIMAVQGQ